MSVRTTADERIDQAREHVKSAIKNLQEALDEDTWGHDDYKEEYIDELFELTHQLRKIKRKL